jgi:hypothetical protein
MAAIVVALGQIAAEEMAKEAHAYIKRYDHIAPSAGFT